MILKDHIKYEVLAGNQFYWQDINQTEKQHIVKWKLLTLIKYDFYI